MAKSLPFRYPDKDDPIYIGLFTVTSHLKPQPQPQKEPLPSERKSKEKDQ